MQDDDFAQIHTLLLKRVHIPHEKGCLTYSYFGFELFKCCVTARVCFGEEGGGRSTQFGSSANSGIVLYQQVSPRKNVSCWGKAVSGHILEHLVLKGPANMPKKLE